jgi:hypothetical protein
MNHGEELAKITEEFAKITEEFAGVWLPGWFQEALVLLGFLRGYGFRCCGFAR